MSAFSTGAIINRDRWDTGFENEEEINRSQFRETQIEQKRRIENNDHNGKVDILIEGKCAGMRIRTTIFNPARAWTRARYSA